MDSGCPLDRIHTSTDWLGHRALYKETALWWGNQIQHEFKSPQLQYGKASGQIQQQQWQRRWRTSKCTITRICAKKGQKSIFVENWKCIAKQGITIYISEYTPFLLSLTSWEGYLSKTSLITSKQALSDQGLNAPSWAKFWCTEH